MAETLTLNTIEQLKAIAHPLRQQLLEQFSLKPATTKQVATALGLQPTRLYHHVAKLEAAGLIKLVETRPVRGTTEKYYSMAASMIKIDTDAMPDAAGKAIGQQMSLGVFDSLFANIRNNISQYLSECGDEEAQQEIMFVQGEFELTEAKAVEFRDAIVEKLRELNEASEADDSSSQAKRTYRSVIGWYPIAEPKN